MKSGGEYVYDYVGQDIVDQFMKAPSKGRFYADVIKKMGDGSQRIINKTVGPQLRNPGKGPTT